MNWVICPYALTHRIGEDRAQQPDSAGRGSLAAIDARQPKAAGFDSPGGLAFSDAMHEPLDIAAADCGNRRAAEQRLYVALDPAAIGQQGASLFRAAASGQQPASFHIGEV